MSDASSSSRGRVAGALKRLSRSLWLPALLAACIALPKLNQGDFNVDTGRYAALSLQAWRSAAGGDLGALVTLREAGGAEGVRYFNKPPMVFWLHGPAMLAAGPHLWAARLAGVAAAVAAASGLAWVVARGCQWRPRRDDDGLGRDDAQVGRRAGVLAGCVLATTYTFTTLSHAISPDLWQAVFIILAFAPAVEAVRRERGAWLALCGVGVGLALLTKPLVALLAPVILLAWLAWERRWRWLGWGALSVVVALAIAAPWYIAMIAMHGQDFLDEHFGREVMSRAAGRLPGMDGRGDGPLYYVKLLFETYWPWLPALVAALVCAAIGKWPRRWRPWMRLAVLWFVLYMVAMALHPDKRPRYMAVLYPPAAWLIGMWLASLPGLKYREAISGGLRVAGPAAIAVAVLISALPLRVHSREPRHWRDFFTWREENGRPELWEAGFGLPESSRVYLAEGKWPRPTHDGLERRIADPPKGALLAYHRRHHVQPGPGEEVVFQSEDASVTVTRLIGGEWRPTVTGPGEE